MVIKIKTHPINSSNLSRAGYDAKTKTLIVHFKNGTAYQYAGIPKELYEGIFLNSSPGNFFREHIVKSGYGYKKLK
jgi:hypothetical protein